MEDVDATACEADEGGVAFLACGSLAVVVGPDGRLTNNQYTYDPAGNLTSITDNPTSAGGQGDAQCFRYDHLRRLTTAWTTVDCQVDLAS